MFYIVYQTKNTLNNKIYVGVHRSKTLTDEYLGSGVKLKEALNELGKENFYRENLFVYDNPQDMINKEIEIVNYNFIKRDDTYNVSLGGGNPRFEYHTEETKMKIAKATIGKTGNPGSKNGMFNRNHTQESKDIMTLMKTGENNKTTGTVWANNGVDNIRVDINNIPAGFVKGRFKPYKAIRTEQTCPHCGLTGKGPNMKRYHFDKCKQKL